MECPASIEITLGELGDEILARLHGRRYPLSGSMELTERCNLSCAHCYINQPAGSSQAAASELALAEIRRLLDQVADAGCLFLLLTGGEPLLRPDFGDIYQYVRRKGIIVTLFTNGTLLTARIADLLAEWSLYSMEITLYGATQETYERVTGVPGSYARCMRGIELALDRGLKLSLKSVVMRSNRHELGAMKSLAEGLGLQYRFDGVLFPRADGDQSVLVERLPAAEVVALDQEYPERQEDYARVYRKHGAGPQRTELVYNCGAGYRNFHIDCRGRLSACMVARRPSYDLLGGTFQAGWEDFLATVISRKRALDTSCRTCPSGILCRQCPAWSQLVHGDDETPDEYVCEMGRLLAGQIVPLATTASDPGLSPPLS